MAYNKKEIKEVKVEYKGEMVTINELAERKGAAPYRIGYAHRAGFRKLSDQDQDEYRELLKKERVYKNKAGALFAKNRTAPELTELKKKARVEIYKPKTALEKKMEGLQTEQELTAETKKHRNLIQTFIELTQKELAARDKEIRELKEAARIPETPYPIVKLDRATTQNLLSVFMNKGIFSNYTKLKSADEILAAEKERLNKPDDFTFKEERAILQKAGEYKRGGYVIRDYGTCATGFTSKLYIDYIEKTEDELKRDLLTPTLFPEMNKNIEEALKKIRLYKIAHKLAFVILSEGYNQRKFRGLRMTKQRIVELLGYSTSEKQIYRDISEVLASLRWLDYIFFNYDFTKTQKKPKKAKGEATGNFIYNIEEDRTSYTFSVNEKFAGCVQFLIMDALASKKERKELFKRGYYSYPTRALPYMKDYSTPAYLLTQFLFRERGNKHLKGNNHKVIAYKVERYITEAGITVNRPGEKYKSLLSTLREIDLITKLDPAIADLEKIKPSKRLNTMLYISIPDPAERLDKQIELKMKAEK